MTRVLIVLAFLTTGLGAAPEEAPPPLWQAFLWQAEKVVVDDFQSYEPDGLPTQWRRLNGRQLAPLAENPEEGEYVGVQKEDGRKFLRLRTDNESVRIVLPNVEGEALDWNLSQHPHLRWEWRAVELPPGAREDEINDTGAAFYVTFSSDWLGRPRSIKYTYSSTLPVGTVIDQGPLKVLVIASGKEPGVGRWNTVRRDVRADYRQLFGGSPPERPISVALWSDSDTTGERSVADFDNIVLLSASNVTTRK